MAEIKERSYKKEIEKLRQEKRELIEMLKVKLIMDADCVNRYANIGDRNKNRTNYGRTSLAAEILNKLGVPTSVPCYGDDEDMLRINFIEIDGRMTKYDYPWRI